MNVVNIKGLRPLFSWVQERIAEDPSLLGLGDLILKDKERIHPQGGRLDILCQDAESNRCYEIEIQLGKSDVNSGDTMVSPVLQTQCLACRAQ